MGPGPRDPGPQDHKSCDLGPPSKLKSGTLEISPLFNEFFFSEYFVFFFLFAFFSFLNNKHNIRPSGFIGLSGEFICGLRGMTYTRKSLSVRNRNSINIPSFLLSYPCLIIIKLVATIYNQILTQILSNLCF